MNAGDKLQIPRAQTLDSRNTEVRFVGEVKPTSGGEEPEPSGHSALAPARTNTEVPKLREWERPGEPA